MTDYSLQVGAASFWREARRDIAAARRRVLVQAMTFEGDAVGLDVAAVLTEAQAADRRVLVDDYSRHVINDTVLLTTRDPTVLAEAKATRQMFDELVRRGVGVRITQPIDGRPLRYPMRNHRKLMVIDDAVWIGGINFSDHNFAWHDMMVRIADAQVADWLAQEFEADWQARTRMATRAFPGGLTLSSLSGDGNRQAFAPLFELFAGARRRLEVLSPYPTFPFVDAIARAAARGTEVVIYTPRPNNKPVVRDYIVHAARRHGITVRLLPEMSHAKAALVDDEVLVVGSTNFDFVSARTSAELFATIRDKCLVEHAQELLFEPVRQHAEPLPATDRHPWRGLGATFALRAADVLIARLPYKSRTVPWPRLAERDPPG